MPRNASGTYTLPNSAFVTNTTIASTIFNGNFTDIATAITQSLATTGVATMTGVLPGFAGTVGAPGYTTNLNLTTGFYRKSANTWAFASGGVEVVDFASAGITAQSINFADRNNTNILSLPVGVMFDYGGTVAPTGWLLCYGQAISQATYSALFAVISTTYGNPGGGNFNVPDLRGRVLACLDNLGGTAANRLTNSASNGVDGSAIANSGGLQNLTITQSMFPSYTLTNSLTASITGGAAASGVVSSDGAIGTTRMSSASGVVVTGTVTGNVATGGSGTALNTVQPSIILTKIIYTGIYP